MADEVITADDDAFPETEEVVEEDKTEVEETENKDKEKEEEKPKTRRSEIAQKKHWRDKATEANSKVAKLEEELTELRKGIKQPTDEAEKKAQEYIRERAREVFLELKQAEAKEESSRTSKLNSELETILEDNPEIAESELLDAMDEYEVEPKTALKILKKQGVQVKKPKLPTPKRAATKTDSLPDDSKKSMWDIVKEEKAKHQES